MSKPSPVKLDDGKVSVVIPAYNQPDYLRRALQSTVEQTHRPLEVIVSDDDSPVCLEPVVKEFLQTHDSQLRVTYFRQQRNLGIMDNFRFTAEQATGKYLVPFAHDNRFTDRGFLADAVHLMQSRAGCHLCFANATFENSVKEMLAVPEGISAGEEWVVLRGDEFIRMYRRGGLDWSQAVVVDHEKARSLKAYDEPFMINRGLALRLGLAEDNAYAFVFILSAVGSIAFSRKCVCEIGTPVDSYSRSDPKWNRTKKKVKFIIFFNLYRADLQGPYAPAVKHMAFKQALDYVDHICDFKIAGYYRYHPGFLLLMLLSVLRRPWIELRYFIKRRIGQHPITGKRFKKGRR